MKQKYRSKEILQSNYWRYKVGYDGELKVDYQLSLLPDNDFHHIPSLRLKSGEHYFQIDSLIITPKVIFILEIKNMKGTLEYSSHFGQLIQTTADKETGYASPLAQVNIQKRHLSQWLQTFNINISIEPFVISTNYSAVIKNTYHDETFQHRFMSLNQLLDKLNNIYHSFPKRILNTKDILILKNNLLKSNQPHISNLIEQQKIKEHHLINGVPYPNCHVTLRWWCGKKFYCKQCQGFFQNEHIQAIYDYLLLHRPYITNEECRVFSQIPNSAISYKILSQINLSPIGKNKGRKYISPKIEAFPQNTIPFFSKFQFWIDNASNVRHLFLKL